MVTEKPCARTHRPKIPTIVTTSPTPLLMMGVEINTEVLAHPRHGGMGDGGEAASGVTSPQPSVMRGERRHVDQGLKQISVKLSHGLLILEGIDEDVDDAMRDELMVMARDDPIWMEELRRYLHKEEKERERMQKERVARLVRWREDMAIKPT